MTKEREALKLALEARETLKLALEALEGSIAITMAKIALRNEAKLKELNHD